MKQKLSEKSLTEQIDEILLVDAKRRIVQLETEINDWRDTFRIVLADECAPDERHCTCVPFLREGVAQLEEQLKYEIGLTRAHSGKIAALKRERLVVCEHCEKTIAENAALRRGLRHAHYSVHWHDPDGCSGCEEVDALLTAEEQDEFCPACDAGTGHCIGHSEVATRYRSDGIYTKE